MTNSELLKQKMQESGYKLRYIAQRIGLSYQGMMNKVMNKHEFTAGEIQALCDILCIPSEERDLIFFN